MTHFSRSSDFYSIFPRTTKPFPMIDMSIQLPSVLCLNTLGGNIPPLHFRFIVYPLSFPQSFLVLTKAKTSPAVAL